MVEMSRICFKLKGLNNAIKDDVFLYVLTHSAVDRGQTQDV